jgi:peptide/nickel transport system permease protein
MQRYIARRALQSLLAILAMSLIVFSLARITGNPLDVMLPLEAGPEEYERVSRYWGLDQPLHTQYVIFLSKAVRGDFGTTPTSSAAASASASPWPAPWCRIPS